MSSLLNEDARDYENLAETIGEFFWKECHALGPTEAELVEETIWLSEARQIKFPLEHSDEPLTTNDFKAFDREQQVQIIFSRGDTETLEEWTDGVYQAQTIYIDIKGKHNWGNDEDPIRIQQMEALRKLIDQVLFENLHLTQLRKYIMRYINDPEDPNYDPNVPLSQFTGFLDFAIDWERIHENLEHGIIEQIAGELRVSTQRVKNQ